jgi:hypothetical protein
MDRVHDFSEAELYFLSKAIHINLGTASAKSPPPLLSASDVTISFQAVAGTTK